MAIIKNFCKKISTPIKISSDLNKVETSERALVLDEKADIVKKFEQKSKTGR